MIPLDIHHRLWIQKELAAIEQQKLARQQKILEGFLPLLPFFGTSPSRLPHHLSRPHRALSIHSSLPPYNIIISSSREDSTITTQKGAIQQSSSFQHMSTNLPPSPLRKSDEAQVSLMMLSKTQFENEKLHPKSSSERGPEQRKPSTMEERTKVLLTHSQTKMIKQDPSKKPRAQNCVNMPARPTVGLSSSSGPAGSSTVQNQVKDDVEAANHSAMTSNEAHKPKALPVGSKSLKWMQSYDLLKEYKDEYGDCLVPRGYPENPKLGSWVAEQRKQYQLRKSNRPSSITDERIQLLDALDFSWNAQASAWRRQINDLKSFSAEHGHCHVPLKHPKYPKLGLWTKEQRRHYTLMKQGRPSHMTEARMEELNKIGFVWDTHESIFAERLRKLADYKKEHGNCAVPTTYQGNPKLATWCQHQRLQYKKFQQGDADSYMAQEKIDALNRLNFVWNPRLHKTTPSSSSSLAGAATTISSEAGSRRRPSASLSSVGSSIAALNGSQEEVQESLRETSTTAGPPRKRFRHD